MSQLQHIVNTKFYKNFFRYCVRLRFLFGVGVIVSSRLWRLIHPANPTLCIIRMRQTTLLTSRPPLSIIGPTILIDVQVTRLITSIIIGRIIITTINGRTIIIHIGHQWLRPQITDRRLMDGRAKHLTFATQRQLGALNKETGFAGIRVASRCEWVPTCRQKILSSFTYDLVRVDLIATSTSIPSENKYAIKVSDLKTLESSACRTRTIRRVVQKWASARRMPKELKSVSRTAVSASLTSTSKLHFYIYIPLTLYTPIIPQSLHGLWASCLSNHIFTSCFHLF